MGNNVLVLNNNVNKAKKYMLYCLVLIRKIAW